MSEIINRIQELFPNNLELSSRHSYFQLQYFLIGKEPTNQAKMWQCLKELSARKDTLENLDLQTEEEKDNLEYQNLIILELEKEENKNDLNEIDKKKIFLKKRSTERKIKSINKNLISLSDKKKNIEEECNFFIETFKSINKNEALKHFDDLSSQKDYWGKKLMEKFNLKLILGGNIDADLIETILALPDDIPIKKVILNKINTLTAEVKKINNNG